MHTGKWLVVASLGLLAGCEPRDYGIVGVPFCDGVPRTTFTEDLRYVYTSRDGSAYGVLDPSNPRLRLKTKASSVLLAVVACPSLAKPAPASNGGLTESHVPAICDGQKVVFHGRLDAEADERAKLFDYAGVFRFPEIPVTCREGTLFRSTSETLVSRVPYKVGDPSNPVCAEKPFGAQEVFVKGARAAYVLTVLSSHYACAFSEGDVVKKNAAGELVVAGEGLFTAKCTNPGVQEIAFVSSRVARVELVVSSGLTFTGPVRGKVTMKRGATMAIGAQPLDGCGRKLYRGLPGFNALWKLDDACSGILRNATTNLKGELQDLSLPSDGVGIRGEGPGTCKLSVDYFGVPEVLEVTVE
jgi:hypothetical protein